MNNISLRQNVNVCMSVLHNVAGCLTVDAKPRLRIIVNKHNIWHTPKDAQIEVIITNSRSFNSRKSRVQKLL